MMFPVKDSKRRSNKKITQFNFSMYLQYISLVFMRNVYGIISSYSSVSPHSVESSCCLCLCDECVLCAIYQVLVVCWDICFWYWKCTWLHTSESCEEKMENATPKDVPIIIFNFLMHTQYTLHISSPSKPWNFRRYTGPFLTMRFSIE